MLLAEMIWSTSCAVRDRALAISQEHEEQELERKTQAAAARSVVTSIELRNADQTIARLAISAARKVHRDGRCTKKDIVNGCFKKPEQAAIPQVIAYAEAQRWVVPVEAKRGDAWAPGSSQASGE